MDLPVGISDFRELVKYKNAVTGEGYAYVDKSLFIKEILSDSAKVAILTRPRRFGKTLNLSMLHYFFAAVVNGQSTKDLFNNLAIANELTCMQYQGQYPVIFITFKDVKFGACDLCVEHIKLQIIGIYSEYRFLLQSNKLDVEEKDIFQQILTNQAKEIYWYESLKLLTKFINKATKNQAVVLIDEYDTPIQEAYLHGYYDKLILFIRNLFSSVLKDNIFLKRAVLTGILRVSKESLFSGLSNVKVYSVLHKQYANCFGFTENETNDLLVKTKLPADLQQTKQWYNGYNFGGTTIYNPWSIIEFINEEGRLRSYWVNTSGNYLIKHLITNSSSNIQAFIGDLIAGKTIKEYVDEHVVFSDLSKNSAALWSLLLMSGYLKYTICVDHGRRYICDLKLPNNEVLDFYVSVIEEWLSGDRGFVWYQEFLSDLANGRVEQFAEKLQTLIEETLSFHDVTKKSQESFYHGLMLAFISGLKDTHFINSNKESGKGLYDVAIIPKDVNKLGIVMEFKAVDSELKLEDAAQDALIQIKKSKYIVELRRFGVNNICSMGISFSGKAIKIVTSTIESG